MQARQVPNGVADIKLHHADDALARLLAAVVRADRQMLDQADSLGDLDLFLFRQMIRRTTDGR